MQQTNQPKTSFFKVHVLPALFIFLIPGFSAWFFSSAEKWMDTKIQETLESNIQADRGIPEAEKAKIIEFYRQAPASKIMASNNSNLASMQAMLEPTKLRYATFRWMKRIAWTCLITIGATFVIVGLSVAFSFRSQAAQYRALRLGWPVLRTSAAIQVLGQAVLAVALSFWVTAILTNSYFIKLIAIIALLAICAVLTLWKAIFTKVNDRFEISGSMISEADAPTLWQRVREMAAKLGTQAPERIVVGITPNFFVTEHPAAIGGEVQTGRTLFLSLPMLKILAVDEADAVLGHELAHFSGQDTLWSHKISPIIGKFAIYLGTLAQGLSVVVAHFMHLFWKLYNLSIRKLSRAREFRADQIGAELVTKDAMKRALVKITCYCEYSAKTEEDILATRRIDEGLNLALQLEKGYPEFLASFASETKSINERVPHPFDTHPTLSNRLEHLGFEVHAALHDHKIQEPAADSWYDAINAAPAIEERMWAERQQQFRAFHLQHLAWTLQPKDAEEEAIVREHFPHSVFHKKNGDEATLDFDRIQLPEWEAAILFSDIVNTKLEDSWGKKKLTLTHRNKDGGKPLVTKCYPGVFTREKATLLGMFIHYYSRHKSAEQNSRRQP